jgi:hypothetical protein
MRVLLGRGRSAQAPRKPLTSGDGPGAGADGDEEPGAKKRRVGDDGNRDEDAQDSNELGGNSADVNQDGGDSAEQPRDAGGAEESEEARRPTVACDPGRPTRREFLARRCTHWPFRSWCKHCVRGRPVCSPHRKKNQEAKDFAQDGRVPTLTIDHCFLGSEEEDAAANPFLIAYDGYSGALCAVAVVSRGAKIG